MGIGDHTRRAMAQLLFRSGYEIRRIGPRSRSQRPSSYSNFGEQSIIQRHLHRLPGHSRFVVDIAAGDGVTSSNSLALFEDGWSGLAVEYDPQKFARLAFRYSNFEDCQLSRSRVTPPNVAALLAAHVTPREFGLLSLDIDSFDHDVLDEILRHYRPWLLCAEVNEKIPPPVKFTVTYRDDHRWAGDHFYGQSIAMLADLADRHDYALVELEYNNAFLVAAEHAPSELLTVDEIYRRGYLDRTDRLDRLPWNRDMESAQGRDPEETLRFISAYFSRYEGRFVCEL